MVLLRSLVLLAKRWTKKNISSNSFPSASAIVTTAAFNDKTVASLFMRKWLRYVQHCYDARHLPLRFFAFFSLTSLVWSSDGKRTGESRRDAHPCVPYAFHKCIAGEGCGVRFVLGIPHSIPCRCRTVVIIPGASASAKAVVLVGAEELCLECWSVRTFRRRRCTLLLEQARWLV